MNEEINQKYIKLLYTLNKIKEELNKLNEDIPIFKEYLTENFLINNEIIEKEGLNLFQAEIKNISDDLTNNLIPMIKNRIE